MQMSMLHYKDQWEGARRTTKGKGLIHGVCPLRQVDSERKQLCHSGSSKDVSVGADRVKRSERGQRDEGTLLM